MTQQTNYLGGLSSHFKNPMPFSLAKWKLPALTWQPCECENGKTASLQGLSYTGLETGW